MIYGASGEIEVCDQCGELVGGAVIKRSPSKGYMDDLRYLRERFALTGEVSE